mgnify:CR=1 FL=1
MTNRAKEPWIQEGAKVRWRSYDWTITEVSNLSGCVGLNGIDMLVLRAPFGELREAIRWSGQPAHEDGCIACIGHDPQAAILYDDNTEEHHFKTYPTYGPNQHTETFSHQMSLSEVMAAAEVIIWSRQGDES